MVFWKVGINLLIIKQIRNYGGKTNLLIQCRQTNHRKSREILQKTCTDADLFVILHRSVE